MKPLSSLPVFWSLGARTSCAAIRAALLRVPRGKADEHQPMAPFKKNVEVPLFRL